MRLHTKGAVITGASMGLGLAIAEAFVREGANVVICARGKPGLISAEAQLKAIASPQQVIQAIDADVSLPADVRRVFEVAESTLSTIDVLVNNAGVLGPIGLVEDTDWEEWTSTVQVNLFGPVLMTRAFLPTFKRQGSGKIINLSGGGATGPRPRVSAYAAAKAAVVRFTETIAEETKGIGIDVNAVAPGALNTRMLEQMLDAGPDRAGDEYQRSTKQKAQGGASLERSAALCVFLASAESNGITGKLLSAIWDPWHALAQHRDELSGDVYTLRRISPKDRGMTWGDVDGK